MLIFDGHRSHGQPKLLVTASQHNTILFRLPAHCTHKLQPLDVGILGPLQQTFSVLVDEFVELHGRRPNRPEFVTMYLDARDITFKKSTILSAWGSCGISPRNSNIFHDKEFAPSLINSTSLSAHLPSEYPLLEMDPSEDWDHQSAGVESLHDSFSEFGGGDGESEQDHHEAQEEEFPDLTLMESTNVELRYSVRRPGAHESYHSPSTPPTTQVPIPVTIPENFSPEEAVRWCRVLSMRNVELTEQTKVALAHASFAGRRLASFQARENAKKVSKTKKTTGTLNAFARVLNTDDVVAQLLAEEAERNADAALRNARLAAVALYPALSDWHSQAAVRGALWERVRVQDQKQRARVRVEVQRAIDKCAKAAEKAQRALERDAKAMEKAETARLAKEAKEQERDQKRREKEEAASVKQAAASAKKLAAAEARAQKAKAVADRRLIRGMESEQGARKKRKVSSELAVDEGKENDAEELGTPASPSISSNIPIATRDTP